LILCAGLWLAACGGEGSHDFLGFIYDQERPPGTKVTTFPVEREPPFSPGIFPCSRCHVGGQPAQDPNPQFPHRAHLERDLACADCHMPDGGADPKVPDPALCNDCHEDLAGEPEAVQRYFALIKTDKGYAFPPRRWQTGDVTPAHPKHAKAGVECTACHGEPGPGTFAKPKAVPLMRRCQGCHEERQASEKCETCHSKIREPQHKNIVLHHAEDQRGCLDCHNPDDRDTLRLANGTTVSFKESYRLCGQCHGPKYRDWKEGLHGKRTGHWDGRKEYYLCVHCHSNPHSPRFPDMKPLPPPTRPDEVK